MSDLFVVGISWRTAPVAVREKLAFREDELTDTLLAMTRELPVAEALLISTCNRVEVYGVAKAGRGCRRTTSATVPRRRSANVKLADLGDVLYEHRGPQRDPPRVLGRERRSIRSSSARRRSSASSRTPTRSPATAGTSGPVLGRCARARVRRREARAHRDHDRARRRERLVGRGRARRARVRQPRRQERARRRRGQDVARSRRATCTRTVRQRIIVTNRSPEKAEALADEIEGIGAAVERARGAARRGRCRDQLDRRARADPDQGDVQEGRQGPASTGR